MTQLPQSVRIREVGPRDGFQNEPEVIATDDKVRLVDALARTGLRRLEVTSFVRADVIPQLADAERGAGGIDRPPDVSVSVLIPNERGLQNALGQPRALRGDQRLPVGVGDPQPQERQPLDRASRWSAWSACSATPAARACAARGSSRWPSAAPTRATSRPSACSRSPRQLARAGAEEIGFGDTTGMANPVQVREFFEQARAALGDDVELTAHFHNTRGQGLANVLAALEAGVDSFESSFGELGGCPVPAGATGNIATEDLVSMLHEMGIETGIDLARCWPRRASVLGRPLGSHTLVAGPFTLVRPRHVVSELELAAAAAVSWAGR